MSHFVTRPMKKEHLKTPGNYGTSVKMSLSRRGDVSHSCLRAMSARTVLLPRRRFFHGKNKSSRKLDESESSNPFVIPLANGN
jgi:hypothetical protein